MDSKLRVTPDNNVQDVYLLLLPIFSCPVFNKIALLAYEDASLLNHYYCYRQKM